MADLLTSNITQQTRNFLESRNFYTPDNPYQIDNPKVTQAINAISKIVNPTKSFDLTNTVFGRLIGPNTPIAQIGIEQLGKQFAQRVTQNALTAGLPSINFNNLFDGNPNTKLLTKRVDYRITADPQEDTVQNIIDRASGTQPIVVPYKMSPPISYTVQNNDSQDNATLLKNTGKGVLHFFYDAMNRNLFKKSDYTFLSTTSSVNFEIVPAGGEWFNRIIFPTNDPVNFPNYEFAALDYLNALTTDLQNASIDPSGFEYGSDSYQRRLGRTSKNQQDTAQNLPNQPRDKDFEITDQAYGFINSNSGTTLIWGYDGLSTFESKFGARAGMLAYTRALLQARGIQNSSMNQTLKKWYDSDGNPIYNGSPLTRDNDGTVRTERQFNIIDPYNRYSKAIRFDGNQVYNAPQESVINKFVIPKMHPIFNKDNKDNPIDNENMMFSIENLAYQLSVDGYLGDSLGTKVPKSEVGPVHRGRLMWFPPYAIQLSESAIAKYDSTTFIGRGEPIYTYSNSERIARLSFKLIVDYPPQIKGATQGQASKFFAFGGTIKQSDLGNVDVPALEAENNNLTAQLNSINPNKTQKLSPPPPGDYCTIYFPNDVPNSNITDIGGVLAAGYETGVGIDPIDGTVDTGLNGKFAQSVLDFVNNTLNPTDPDVLKLVKLTFTGSATKLYAIKTKQYQYNLDLSTRRNNALYNYVQNAFQSAYGKTMEAAGITIAFKPLGSVNGSNAGAFPANMNNAEIKPERNSKVVLTDSGAVITKPVDLTTDEKNQRQKLQEKIDANKKLIAAANAYQADTTLFRLKLKDGKMETGFEAVEKRQLSPVFHSQTPEDFHRRLTFLQQCTRQGNSTINQNTANSGIATSKNSTFGRPPICILRIGDFFHTKVVIDSIDFDYADSPWDMNPEGMGMQFMIADISMTMRVIGGQSLKAAIDVLQNAESFNYYANSSYYAVDVYKSARAVENAQVVEDIANRSASDAATAVFNKPQTQPNSSSTPTVS